MGRHDERLRELNEERDELNKLRESGLGDKDAIDERIDSLDKKIEETQDRIDSDADEAASKDTKDASDKTQTGPDGERAPTDNGPMDIDKVHQFDTFPEAPATEPAPPVEEPINAWELDGAGGTRADGGDVQRPDSVLPDLGKKGARPPISDEAEAAIGNAGRPSEGQIADIKVTMSSGQRPPSDIPRTQEKPGTGAKDPKPEKPWTPKERPTGQITDEDGKYGDERTFYNGDGETDWNKVNRGPVSSRKLTSKQLRAVVGILAAAALVGIVFRPGTSTTTTQPAQTAAVSAAARTNASAATEPTGPAAQIATAAGYQCVGQQKALFDNSNGNLVSNGAASGPSFNTGGKAYCLVSMSTYHWNEGKGAGPGRVGLVGSAGNVGPTQAQGTSGQGGAQNVNWVYVPDANARPLLNGDYSCYDSDKATWSQNEASGRAGFCRVFVLDAVKP